MKGKVYFASPWFTKSQAEREERVKNKLRELGLNVFSPKESDNGLSPITDPKIRKQIFASNINKFSRFRRKIACFPPFFWLFGQVYRGMSITYPSY